MLKNIFIVIYDIKKNYMRRKYTEKSPVLS